MAETLGFSPFTPIQERIIRIGNDELIPLQLTPQEIRFLFDTVKEEVGLTDEFTADFYQKLEVLKKQPLIAIEDFRQDLALRGESITLFDSQDLSYITFYRPPNSRAKKQEKYWRKRFEKENGRSPTEDERRDYIHFPGYQVQVLGADYEVMEGLKTKLKEKGFPIARYRGLEIDDIGAEEGKEMDLTRLGGPSHPFNQKLNDVLSELRKDGLDKLKKAGKITFEQLVGLRSNPEELRKLAYDITISLVRNELKANNPNLSETQIDGLMLVIDVWRLTGKLG